MPLQSLGFKIRSERDSILFFARLGLLCSSEGAINGIDKCFNSAVEACCQLIHFAERYIALYNVLQTADHATETSEILGQYVECFEEGRGLGDVRHSFRESALSYFWHQPAKSRSS